MNNFMVVVITATMLTISISFQAETSESVGQAKGSNPKSIKRVIATPLIKKDLKKAPDAHVVLPAKRAVLATPVPVYKKAVARPAPIAIKSDSIRLACLTGDLQMGEALQIFNEYFDDSEYKEQHEISGIRLTRDRDTRETVYQVDLCPVVRYYDDGGNELEASFFVDMRGEIFITERIID